MMKNRKMEDSSRITKIIRLKLPQFTSIDDETFLFSQPPANGRCRKGPREGSGWKFTQGRKTGRVQFQSRLEARLLHAGCHFHFCYGLARSRRYVRVRADAMHLMLSPFQSDTCNHRVGEIFVFDKTDDLYEHLSFPDTECWRRFCCRNHNCSFPMYIGCSFFYLLQVRSKGFFKPQYFYFSKFCTF